MADDINSAKDRTGQVWDCMPGPHHWLIVGPPEINDSHSNHPALNLYTGQVSTLTEFHTMPFENCKGCARVFSPAPDPGTSTGT